MDPYPLFPDIHVTHAKGGQSQGGNNIASGSSQTDEFSENSKSSKATESVESDDSDDDEIVDAADVVKKSRAHVTHMVRALGAVNSPNASDSISMAYSLSRISRAAIRHAARGSDDPDLENLVYAITDAVESLEEALKFKKEKQILMQRIEELESESRTVDTTYRCLAEVLNGEINNLKSCLYFKTDVCQALSEHLEYEQDEYERVDKKSRQYRRRLDDALDDVSAQAKRAEENARKAEESATQVEALQKELKKVKLEREALQSELEGYEEYEESQFQYQQQQYYKNQSKAVHFAMPQMQMYPMPSSMSSMSSMPPMPPIPSLPPTLQFQYHPISSDQVVYRWPSSIPITLNEIFDAFTFLWLTFFNDLLYDFP